MTGASEVESATGGWWQPNVSEAKTQTSCTSSERKGTQISPMGSLREQFDKLGNTCIIRCLVKSRSKKRRKKKESLQKSKWGNNSWLFFMGVMCQIITV